MKITETKIRIGDLVEGFQKDKYSGSDEDIFCYNGKLNCRPAYQRNYVYDKETVKTKDGKTMTKKEQVINTIFKGYPNEDRRFPMSIMYWQKMPDGTFQILDGQQRTLSALLFRVGDKTLYKGDVFAGLQQAEQEWFDNYKFTVYICEKDENQTEKQFEAEVLEWFDVINITGSPLRPQELRNATYFGSWVSDIKTKFSNEKSEIFKERYKTTDYISIKTSEMNRQEFLETVLKWRSDSLGMSIEEYMSQHRNDPTDTDLFNYFVTVLNWIKSTFTVYNKEILFGQDWGTLYNEYHSKFENLTNEKREEINNEIERVYLDDDIENKNGIVKYILSDKDPKYLQVREFSKQQKERVYHLQNGICPLCEDEQNRNPNRHIKIQYSLKEMEGDHIVPWSRGGRTDDDKNCCMLCKNHNKHKSADQITWLEDYMKNLWEQRENENN